MRDYTKNNRNCLLVKGRGPVASLLPWPTVKFPGVPEGKSYSYVVFYPN